MGDFPNGSAGKESICNAGDTGDAGLIPGSGRSPAGGNGNPLQYSCLENPTDRGAWWAIVHGVTKSQTRLSNFHFDHSPELRASSQVTQGDGEGSSNLVFTYTVARTGFGVRIYPRAQPSSVPGGHVSPEYLWGGCGWAQGTSCRTLPQSKRAFLCSLQNEPQPFCKHLPCGWWP